MLLIWNESQPYTSTRRNSRHEGLNTPIPSGLFSNLTAALSLEQTEQKVSALLVAFDSTLHALSPVKTRVGVFGSKSLQGLHMHDQRLTTLADSIFRRS